MAKIRLQPKDEEIGARSRAVARQALGRIFAAPAAVFLARGEPDAVVLLKRLAALQRLPAPGEQPRPTELGFRASQVSQVDAGLLACWRTALQKWMKILRDRDDLRRVRPDLRAKMEDWSREIGEISEQLDQLYAALRCAESGAAAPPQAYALPHGWGAQADRDLRAAARSGFPPLWLWHCRVAAWIGGPQALRRLLHVLGPQAGRAARDGDGQAILRLKQAVLQGIPDTGKDHRWWARELLNIDGVDQELGRLPERLLKEAGIPTPGRPHERVDYHRRLAAICEEYLARTPSPPPGWAVAGLAAICALDGAEAPPPAGLLLEGDREHGMALFEELLSQRGLPGYEPLTIWLADHPQAYAYNLAGMRCLLAAGVGADDGNWALATLDEKFPEFAAEGFSPAPARSVLESLQKAGAELVEYEAARVIMSTASAGTWQAFRSLADWLAALGPRGLTREFAVGLKGAVLWLAAPQEATPRLRDHLSRWLDPPRRLPPPPDSPPGLPEELRKALALLAHYQRLADLPCTIPSALRKALTAPARRARELEHLRAAAAQGRMTEAMRRRRDNLESNPLERCPDYGLRLLPEARQACAFAAIEALKRGVRRQAADLWHDDFDCDLPPGVGSQDVLAILHWSRTLPGSERAALEAIVSAWREAGPRYRGVLRANRAWIESARAAGVAVDAWLTPPAAETEFDGRKLRIAPADNPFEVFMMGTWFKTCLSLGSCNNRAVVSNSGEANKAVLIVRDVAGTPVGRKLVCLNTQFQMIGFRTYLHWSRSEVEEWIASYCGQWARKAGVSLSNAGLPENLERLFWYDDGIEAWPAAARRSLVLDSQSPETVPPGLHPALAEILQGRLGDCRRLLEDAGVWPEYWGEREDILWPPVLAEEALALVAAKDRDANLAGTVLRHATEDGARLTAADALLRFGGEAAAEGAVACLLGPGSAIEVAAEALASLDRPYAWRWLMRLVAEYNASPEWIASAAARSPSGAAAALSVVADLICRDRIGWDGVRLAIEISESAWGVRLPDSSLQEILRFVLSEECACWSKVENLEWLPIFREPARFLSAELLDCSRGVAPDSSVKQDGPAGALLALRNPCPAARKYLYGLARRSPLARLCLALMEGPRDRDLMESEAARTPWDPAALMAVLAAEGRKEGGRSCLRLGPRSREHGRFAVLTRKLFDAYRALDLTGILSGEAALKNFGTSSCVPVFFSGFWSHLEAFGRGAPPLRLTLKSAGRLSLGARTVLAVRYAARLASASGPDAQALREALSSLFEACLDQPWTAVFADALSGGKLSGTPPGSPVGPYPPISPILGASAMAHYLLAPDGRPSPLALGGWGPELRMLYLPVDPARARLLLDLAAARFGAKAAAEACSTVTEVQRLLVERLGRA